MSSTGRPSQDSGKHFDISAMSAPWGWEQCEESMPMVSSAPCFDFEIEGRKMHSTTPAEGVLAASTWKGLAQSQSASYVGFPESTFTSLPNEEIQAWAKEYFRRKNRDKKFDPSVQVVLSNFIGNFYGLATSLIDFFVDNAVSQAISRNSTTVEDQDFAFVDFALHVENINPNSARLKYKIKHLAKDGFMCPSCGKVPLTSSVIGAASAMATPSKPAKKTMTKAHATQNPDRPTKKLRMSRPNGEMTSGLSSSPLQNRTVHVAAQSSNRSSQGSSRSQNPDFNLI